MGTLQKVAIGIAAVLGLGIISKRFEGGLGLGELGTGITSVGTGIYEVAVSPFKAVGMGLGYVSGGLSSILAPLQSLFGLVTGQAAPSTPSTPSNGAGTRSSYETRPDDRINGGNGVYQVSVAGNGWTFAGAGKIFRQEDRARLKYAESQGYNL